MNYGIFKHNEEDVPILVSKIQYHTIEEAKEICEKLNWKWQTCAYYVGLIGEENKFVSLN